MDGTALYKAFISTGCIIIQAHAKISGQSMAFLARCMTLPARASSEKVHKVPV